jgi:hypothetical protein
MEETVSFDFTEEAAPKLTPDEESGPSAGQPPRNRRGFLLFIP